MLFLASIYTRPSSSPVLVVIVSVFLLQAELEELDHEIREDILENNNDYYGELGDGEDVSEWHSFFTRNLELVAKIAELLPDEIFSLVVCSKWS